MLLRLRRHLLGVVATFALAGVVAVHHADMPMAMPGMGEMAGMTQPAGHSGDGGSDPVKMVACIAALVAIGAGVLAVALGLFRLRWGTSLRKRAPVAWRDPKSVLSRAGPPGTALLCVWRI